MFTVLNKVSVLCFRSTEDDDRRFKCLEVLMLDDNKLSSEVFNSLSKLQRSTRSCKVEFRLSSQSEFI